MDTLGTVSKRAGERVLPSGNVAFLFTDIVGSTVRWERDPQAMRVDVRAHDAVLREAIEAENGYVFKTVGDAFCAAFSSVSAAVEAAEHAQHALKDASFASEGGLSVRMAVHVGESEERDNDYFGPALNRIARLLSIGHGGQVLLSGAAAEAIEAQRGAEIVLRDLGNHRLKDLTAPEHVFQLIARDLGAEFPPLRSLSVLDNNLPQQLTSFIGREEDVADIRAALDGARLVTLSGAGGVGKTRCALQVAAEVLEHFTDGVWFADLAPLGDPSLVPATIARIFEIQEAPNHSILESLTSHLKSKKLLLVLDNCEHVIVEASKVAAALLKGCAQVRILATSREALNVPGEALYRVPSLAPPAAIALFEARGRSVNSRFAVTNENAAIIGDICRRLDGIPLAIELAAARLKMLTPKQLAEKLRERFRLLTGGDRTALPRQQTMRALIDWSYDLLVPREQGLFREISVFAGGFTAETAVAVCKSESEDEMDVFDDLASLADKSLLLAEPSDDAVRYRLLESTHEYAREKLSEAGEQGTMLERHARAFADFAEHLDEAYESLAPAAWLSQGEAEMENLRAALSWSFSPQGDASVGQRIAVTLPRIFGVLAPAEGLRWVLAALKHVTGETPQIMVAGLELAHASFASVFNQFNAALAAGQRAVHAFMALAMPMGLADAQRLVGRSMLYLGRVDEGESLLKESLASRQAAGSKRIGGILGDLAVARALQGDLNGARALFAQASAMFEQGADTSKLAITAATLAEAEFMAGDAAAALRLAEEALASARGLGRYRTVAAILGNMAAYHLEMEHYDQVRTHAREALDICRDIQADVVSVIFALQHLAAVAGLQETGDVAQAAIDGARAAHLLGFVEGRLTELEIEREHTERRGYDKLREVS